MLLTYKILSGIHNRKICEDIYIIQQVQKVTLRKFTRKDQKLVEGNIIFVIR